MFILWYIRIICITFLCLHVFLCSSSLYFIFNFKPLKVMVLYAYGTPVFAKVSESVLISTDLGTFNYFNLLFVVSNNKWGDWLPSGFHWVSWQAFSNNFGRPKKVKKPPSTAPVRIDIRIPECVKLCGRISGTPPARTAITINNF